jgi:preprotein translocase subunit SecD
MNSLSRPFNIILALLAGAWLGCQSTEDNADAKSKDSKDSKRGAFLRFHLERNADTTGRTIQIQVYRAQPMLLTVDRDAVLDEGFLRKAEVVEVDEHGGIALKLTFDEAGARRLDALTIESRGLHFAIRGVWTENRWLAAPVISKRISNGEFIFTPDATREEAERIVAGLKNVIKKLNKSFTII